MSSMTKTDDIQLHWDKQIVMLGPDDYLVAMRESHIRLISKLEGWVRWIDAAMIGLQQGILFELEEEDAGAAVGPGDNIKSHRRLAQQKQWCQQTIGRVKLQLADVDAELATKNFRKNHRNSQ